MKAVKLNISSWADIKFFPKRLLALADASFGIKGWRMRLVMCLAIRSTGSIRSTCFALMVRPLSHLKSLIARTAISTWMRSWATCFVCSVSSAVILTSERQADGSTMLDALASSRSKKIWKPLSARMRWTVSVNWMHINNWENYLLKAVILHKQIDDLIQLTLKL